MEIELCNMCMVNGCGKTCSSVRCILESSSRCPNIRTIAPPNNLVLRIPCRPPIIPVCGRTYHAVCLKSRWGSLGAYIHKKSEATFQTVFYAIFRLLGFNIDAESCTNDGRIDAVVQTDDHIYLFEFKLDDDDIALSQIKEKAYFKKYLQSSKKITMIGVNFDSEKGQLIDWQTEDVVQ